MHFMTISIQDHLSKIEIFNFDTSIQLIIFSLPKSMINSIAINDFPFTKLMKRPFHIVLRTIKLTKLIEILVIRSYLPDGLGNYIWGP